MSFFRRDSDRVVFESVRLKGTGKLGVIKPDKDGCYTQVIGALGAYNSRGDYYDFNAGVRFFKNDSSFMRKIQRGVLKAEQGHPKRNGMSLHEYQERILRIEETLTCGTWRQIWLSNDDLKDEQGRKIIPIFGKIYPSGPFRDSLIHAFESPGEQVCFSIRSFTKDTPRNNGTYFKELLNIVTFDYVTEPGMYNAEKLLSPSIESIEEEVDIKSMINVLDSTPTASMESATDTKEFRNQLADIIEKETKKPSFMRW